MLECISGPSHHAVFFPYHTETLTKSPGNLVEDFHRYINPFHQPPPKLIKCLGLILNDAQDVIDGLAALYFLGNPVVDKIFPGLILELPQGGIKDQLESR